MSEAHTSAPDPSIFSRRKLLGAGFVLGASSFTSPGPSINSIRRARSVAPAGSDLGAVKHVIFLMQENRSFDHYFGTYKGVRGFSDHAATSLGAFAQPYAANTTLPPLQITTLPPLQILLPFHLDTSTGLGECTHDISHDWATQHLSRGDGSLNAFVKTHTSPRNDGPGIGPQTMGYYTRADLPYHYALADAFTICDRYFSSILGPTHPNRLMAMSGFIDPDGRHGGPVLTTNMADALFSVNWTTVPELLENEGISWKTYSGAGNGYQAGLSLTGFGDSILPYFAKYRKASSPLHKKAFLPTFPHDFTHDVRTGTLPSVSWIIPPNGYDEHSPAPPGLGARLIDTVLQTLISNPKVWSQTVLFISYDENGGFFDHVPPPVAPPGTPGEFVTVRPLPSTAGGIAGPLGLGFRVPMLVVSPFSRGGYVSSDTFDHTSQIRFLEARFGIKANLISTWRRRTVGDLTSTLHPTKATMTRPTLPSTASYLDDAIGIQGCSIGDLAETSTDQTPYPPPTTQAMPTQEAGHARRLPRASH